MEGSLVVAEDLLPFQLVQPDDLRQLCPSGGLHDGVSLDCRSPLQAWRQEENQPTHGYGYQSSTQTSLDNSFHCKI